MATVVEDKAPFLEEEIKIVAYGGRLNVPNGKRSDICLLKGALNFG